MYDQHKCVFVHIKTLMTAGRTCVHGSGDGDGFFHWYNVCLHNFEARVSNAAPTPRRSLTHLTRPGIFSQIRALLPAATSFIRWSSRGVQSLGDEHFVLCCCTEVDKYDVLPLLPGIGCKSARFPANITLKPCEKAELMVAGGNECLQSGVLTMALFGWECWRPRFRSFLIFCLQ